MTRLHAELGGKMKENQRQAAKLRADMKHVEAVLKLLEPSFNVQRITPRRRNTANPLFKRGHLFRAVLDVLRASPEPMTVDAIVTELFRSKGVSEAPSADRQRLYQGVNSGLMDHPGMAEHDNGRPRRWRLIGHPA